MEGLSLIDVSAEDDLLFDLATPAPRRPDPPHAGSLVGAEATSSGVSPSAAVRAADPGGVMEEQASPERTESPEQRKAKKGVNLRKSLAWDKAFFTSEGVLDTEELAIVNSTFRKTQGSRLPGIMEEMRRSGESTTSTLESETWAVESLETELFDNVRASIQRSLGKPDKVPGRPAAGSNLAKATANVPRVAARKGVVDRMPQPKVKAPVSTSQGAGGRQRPQITTKEPAAARVNLPGAAEAKIPSKPPRALPRVAMMRSSTNTAVTSGVSDKRSSTGGAVNMQAAGKTASTSAGLRSGGGTKSSSISKSGSFRSAATSSHGMSMDTKPATLNIKNRPAQRVPVHPSSKSDISKTKSDIRKTIPSRSSGNKIPARGHADPASPSISPSSSMDSLSSVISGVSTASTVGKMSHTSENLNALSPSLRKSNDCPPTPKGHSSGTAASGDNLKTTAEIINQGKGFKPSGLRRPTPKIGYFDAEKHIDQNIGAQVQPQPSKVPCLPGTPKSQLPTQNMNVNAAPSTYGQQESKLTAAPHEESCTSKSKVVKPLPLMVEIEPLKVVEPACTHLADPVVARFEAVQPQSMEIQCLLPATPNSQPTFDQQVLKPITAPHEVSACKSNTAKAMPLEDVQMEVEPFKAVKPLPLVVEVEPFKVAEPACTHLIDPVVARPEAVQPQSMEIQCLLPATPNSQTTFDQQVLKPIAAPHEVSACKSNAAKAVPLEAVQMEVEPFKFVKPLPLMVEVEPFKVAEPACTHLTDPVVARPEAVQPQLMEIQCSSACKSNTKAVPLEAVQMDEEHFKVASPVVVKPEDKSFDQNAGALLQLQLVADPEACTRKTETVVDADYSKENIPALHQNIQANVDADSLVELLTQKLSSISLGEATPIVAPRSCRQ